MKFLPRLSSLLFIAGICSVPLTAQPIGAEAEFSGEILTRGPVHEAFAAVVTYNPEAGFIVDRAPPEPIEELPPEERPVDADAAWIPGYWAWDDDRGDYIWISGTWRVLPPGRAWIAGYWRDTGRGWQWVSGYWEDASRREVVYLAPPPETLERGPSSPQPTPNHEWVSGHWEYMDGRYLWRAGYWIEGRADWVWVPSYYVWTPRGHVFVEGYWDYAPVERGLLFAPVYYADYRRPRSYYRPSIVLNVAILSDYLFLRPRYSHYYFGDYYDPRYESSGFYATFDYHTSRRGYDPFYTYSRWRHRDDRDWERNYRTAYEYRRTHEEARPPRRWTGTNLTVNVNQNITNITQVGGSRQTVTYAQPVAQYAQVADAPLRVERVATANVQQQVQVARQVQEQRAQRRTLESQQGATSASVQSGPIPGSASSDRQIGGTRQERSVSAQSVAPVAMPTSPIVASGSGSGRQPPPRAQGNRRDDDRQARQAGQEPARGRESAVPVDQRQPGQETVIGGTTSPRNEPARRAERGLRADNSAAVEAQRLEEQAREQERRQAEEARRGPAVSGQIGAQPRPDLPEQASPRAMERREEAWQQAGEQRRTAAETQERALEQQRQQQSTRDGQGRRDEEQRRAQQQQQQFQRQEQAQQQAQREDQQRREQERQQQQQARQQETDARQQQREAEFQAREQQGRAAEQVRQQQALEQQRAQQAQAAEQQRGQQAREQQRAAEQQAREQQHASDQQAREQQRAAEQQAREPQRAAEQGRQAQPDPRATPPGRGQNQPQPKAAPSKGQSDEEKRKQAEADEEERKKGRRG